MSARVSELVWTQPRAARAIWSTCVQPGARAGVRSLAELPTGTVTFLFTDLEGSTRLWEEHPDAMQAALARHDEILRGAVAGHGGHVVKTTGDGVHAAFRTAHDAFGAAIDAQQALTSSSGVRRGRCRCGWVSIRARPRSEAVTTTGRR